MPENEKPLDSGNEDIYPHIKHYCSDGNRIAPDKLGRMVD
jgi:hypothetical protein